MPTAGEANIRPTNHYNLRNKPLPKTKAVVKKKKTGEKENVPEKPAPSGPVTRSRSKIPLSTNHSSKPSKAVKGREQKPKRKGVPDFAKLHKQWQDKFEKGKAVNKKTCTQVQEFDLTRPGAQFKQAYYNGQSEDNGEDFKEDHEALESILNDEGISESANRGYRNTIATTGTNHASSTSTRKTLGSIPVIKSYRPNNADNLAQSTKKEKPEQESNDLKKPRKSLAQQQQDLGIEFEEDLGALASILNNTGLSQTRAVPTYRQTFASSRGVGGARASLFGGQPQVQKRTSIYYQPNTSSKEGAYEDYTRLVMRRLTTGDNGKSVLSNRSTANPPSTSVRASIYRAALPSGVQQQQSTKARQMPTSTLKSTPGRVHMAHPSKPTGSTQKTPMTASRVPNPHFHSVLQKQEITSSPLLSGSRQMPESHLRTPATQKKVQWAEDTIGIPSAEELATSLFTDQTEPIIKVENRIVQQMEKYKEIEKLEKQLELEIQMLSDLGDLGDSKIPGKGASSDVYGSEDLIERTRVERHQQHSHVQVPVNVARHPLPNDMVTSTQAVNPLSNHGSGVVQSCLPSTLGIGSSQACGNVQQCQQLPAARGMSSSRNDRYTGTPSHQNPTQGYQPTSTGLNISQEMCAVGNTGTMPYNSIQQGMLASTGHNPMNSQCLHCVASQNNIQQDRLGVTCNWHHQLQQSVPSNRGYVAQQMCSQCNLDKTSQPQGVSMLANASKPIGTIYEDKLGTVPVHHVGHLATSAINQPNLPQKFTSSASSAHFEQLHNSQNDQPVSIPSQWAVRRDGEVCNPTDVNSAALTNSSHASQVRLPGNMLDTHHCTHLSGAPLPLKHGFTSTSSIHHHQLPTASMSTLGGGPIQTNNPIQTANPLVFSHLPGLERSGGEFGSPAAVLVPSLKVSKTVTFASPPLIESRERRLCGFRTTPHPGIQQKEVIPHECMDGVKGQLNFGTDNIKAEQMFSTNAAVSNAVVTSSVNTETLSVIKTEHMEPVASTKVKGYEPSILQSGGRSFSASVRRRGQIAEIIPENAAIGNGETLSLKGHLQHYPNKRPMVTEFKGRAGVIFQEALLDQECTLYAHSLQRKLSIGSSSGRDDLDPIAKIFLEKDDTHFCPLLEKSFD